MSFYPCPSVKSVVHFFWVAAHGRAGTTLPGIADPRLAPPGSKPDMALVFKQANSQHRFGGPENSINTLLDCGLVDNGSSVPEVVASNHNQRDSAGMRVHGLECGFGRREKRKR